MKKKGGMKTKNKNAGSLVPCFAAQKGTPPSFRGQSTELDPLTI